jgi:hypothetical protein
VARVTVVNGAQKHLGTFNTKEEAHAAWCAEYVRIHGDHARRE